MCGVVSCTSGPGTWARECRVSLWNITRPHLLKYKTINWGEFALKWNRRGFMDSHLGNYVLPFHTWKRKHTHNHFLSCWSVTWCCPEWPKHAWMWLLLSSSGKVLSFGRLQHTVARGLRPTMNLHEDFCTTEEESFIYLAPFRVLLLLASTLYICH